MIIAMKKIRILTAIAPQFLKYGDCCGFSFLPNNKWNNVSHWLESIIVIISILSASSMYSLRIFDTLELTSNEAIDILKKLFEVPHCLNL